MTINILLAEGDNSEAIHLTDMFLSEEATDFFVEHVGSLAETMRRLKSGLFDILLLNLDLPDSKGFDTLSSIVGPAQNTAIVVLTGLEDTETGRRVIGAGAQDYLVKSRITGSALRRVVRYSHERLKAQKEYERLGRLHKHILKSVGEGVVGTDRENIIAFANPMAAKMLGWTPAELIGANLRDVICPVAQDCDDHVGLLPEVFDEGAAHTTEEWVFRRKDGSTFTVNGTWTPLKDNSQQAGMVLVFRDITQQKKYETVLANQNKKLEDLVEKRTLKLSKEVGDRIRTEMALRESQNRMQAITKSLFECVLVVDVNGHIVFANHSAEVHLNTEEGLKLAGRDLDTVFLLQSEHSNVDFLDSSFYKVALEDDVFTDNDAVFITSDGKALTVAYACSPLIENGKRFGAIISFRDIRKLKAAQREAQQASKLASVGQLAGGIAHEINTPSQYIGDNLTFLRSAHNDLFSLMKKLLSLTNEAHKHNELSTLARDIDTLREEIDFDYLCEEIPSATEQSLSGISQISRIVLAMKEFSHPGTKEMSLANINQALGNTITISSNEWKHVAEMTTVFDESLPAVSCFAGEINQVFLNLIINAAQAIAENPERTGLGRIKVSTESDGESVSIHVEDNGAGIPAGDRDQIFDPFFTTKVVGQGTGQGLSIAWDIVVNKHGGKITFDSTPGVATIFTVKLPIDEKPSDRTLLPTIEEGHGVSTTGL